MADRFDFDLMEQRMAKDFAGPWVRYSDYASLEASLAEKTRERDDLATERDAPDARLVVGSPEWETDHKNRIDHNHWTHGLITPVPERQQELLQWAEKRLFADGWRWAKEVSTERAARQAAEARLAEAERVLEPFATYIQARDKYDADLPDGYRVTEYAPEFDPVVRVTFGEFRAAARALNRQTATASQEERG